MARRQYRTCSRRGWPCSCACSYLCSYSLAKIQIRIAALLQLAMLLHSQQQRHHGHATVISEAFSNSIIHAVRPFLSSSSRGKKCTFSLASGPEESNTESNDSRDPGEQSSTPTSSSDLDDEWKQFKVNKQTETNTGKEQDAQMQEQEQEQEQEQIQAQIQVGLFFLAAVACLGAIFIHFQYLDPSISNSASWGDPSTMDDVDSAKGRFNALTGGLWF